MSVNDERSRDRDRYDRENAAMVAPYAAKIDAANIEIAALSIQLKKLTEVKKLACFWYECLLHCSRGSETSKCLEELEEALGESYDYRELNKQKGIAI